MNENRNDLIFILIDPQKGFTDPAGSLARKYDYDSEFEAIQSALKSIEEYHTKHSGSSVLIRSEYSPGQFSEGELESSLANLCVSGVGVDCEIASGLENCSFEQTFIKHEHSAISNPLFKAYLARQIKSGVRRLVVSGFLLEYCVRATCLDIKACFGERLEIILPLKLSASINRKYGRASFQTMLMEMKRAGVQVLMQEQLERI